jgi:hypothetical protein
LHVSVRVILLVANRATVTISAITTTPSFPPPLSQPANTQPLWTCSTRMHNFRLRVTNQSSGREESMLGDASIQVLPVFVILRSFLLGPARKVKSTFNTNRVALLSCVRSCWICHLNDPIMRRNLHIQIAKLPLGWTNGAGGFRTCDKRLPWHALQFLLYQRSNQY